MTVDQGAGDDGPLAAGDFSTWIVDMQGAIRGDRASEVPCNGCTACCTSSQFVLVEPDEADALAHIPVELVFPAPRMPPGHVVLGYDARGALPDARRRPVLDLRAPPAACRTYDCRIFPAAGVEVDEGDRDKAAIALRARRWQFGFPTADDRFRHEATHRAARFLTAHPECLPGGSVPSPTGIAVLATEIYELFLHTDELGATALVDPEPDLVRAELHRSD